jgi:hypothetical protein
LKRSIDSRHVKQRIGKRVEVIFLDYAFSAVLVASALIERVALDEGFARQRGIRTLSCRAEPLGVRAEVMINQAARCERAEHRAYDDMLMKEGHSLPAASWNFCFNSRNRSVEASDL